MYKRQAIKLNCIVDLGVIPWYTISLQTAGLLFWVLALGVILWHNTISVNLPVHFMLDLGLIQCHNTVFASSL